MKPIQPNISLSFENHANVLIRNEELFLKNIYSKFRFHYYQNLYKQKEKIDYSVLFSFLNHNQLIFYQISHLSCSDNNNNVKFVCCFEGSCYIFENMEEETIISYLKKTKFTCINISNNFDLNLKKELTSIMKNFNYIDDNEFIQQTIKPILAYLIKRYYYPSNFFKDKSFFTFDQKNRVDKNNKKINKFKIDDFIILRNINGYKNQLAIHKESLYLFAIKKEFSNREIEFCKYYSHRCLTKFYGFIYCDSEISGILYEFMSNGSLLEYINMKNSKITKLFSIISMARIFQGIDFLHSKSFVHRDLKPANILIDHDNNAYISDFETIRKVGNDDNESFTFDFCSIIYSSPEHIEGNRIGFSTDIYSFGMILYFLFEKKEPFYGLKQTEMIINKEIDKYPQMSNEFKDIQNIYLKCVKYDQSQRPTNEYIKKFIINQFNSDLISTKDILKYNISEQEYSSLISQYLLEVALFEVYSKKKPRIPYIADKIYMYLIQISNFSNIFNYMANKYSTEKADSYNEMKAKELYEMAAQKDDLNAIIKLGQIYYEGIGVPKDIWKAKNYFEIAAEKGCSEALYQLGIFYMNEKSIRNNNLIALKYFKLAAAKHNTNSLLKLGDIYYDGIIVTKDFKMARNYYELAASQNNPKALLRLGDLYYYGEGIKQNYESAIEYYEKSLQFNNLDASYKLGYIYYNGIGVNVDIKKAVSYYSICVEMHLEKNQLYYSFSLNRSRNDLGLIFLLEYDFFNIHRSNDLLKNAAYGEYPLAQNNYGVFCQFYMNDIQTAEIMFNNASKKKFALSDFNLGHLYEVLGEFDESIKYYIKASKHGDNPLIYRNQKIEDEQLENSKKFIMCIVNLKLCYFFLSQSNREKGKYYFRKAMNKLIPKTNDSSNMFILDLSKSNAYSFLNMFILTNVYFKDRKKEFKFTQLLIISWLILFSYLHKNSSRRIMKFNHLLLEYKDPNQNNIIYDVESFFDYLLNDSDLFMKTINLIIQEMNVILYSYPYPILFGRLKFPKPPILKKNINQLFYEGLGSII